MIHYHGTPITPVRELLTLAGRHFCVSHMRPDDVTRCHQIGQSVMLDNGAFSKWKSGKQTDWESYYEWCDKWLDYPTTWAVIPDVIDEGTQAQESLVRDWPYGDRGSPVWHMDEPISRLLSLCEDWHRVCVGSTAEYAVVMSSFWCMRMDEAFNEIEATFKRIPNLHMLRGMKLSGRQWPFASADSTDIAQNHHLKHNTARSMADRWDGAQCPGRWTIRPHQTSFL